eukprot:Amastigsp_a517429_69.p3 type:complete len:102 gc:universal Amastigsp_a517429_69:323-628(+)
MTARFSSFVASLVGLARAALSAPLAPLAPLPASAGPPCSVSRRTSNSTRMSRNSPNSFCDICSSTPANVSRRTISSSPSNVGSPSCFSIERMHLTKSASSR